MRRPMVVANWKMYTRASDAYILATTIRNMLADVDGIETVICPPFVWLSEISEILKRDGKVNVGAQNMFYENEGPYTGEISPQMIGDIAKYVIVGHSERREYFHEHDLEINEKVLAALKHGLSPIVCVGERKKNDSPDLAAEQLREALTHVPKNRYKDIVVCYEPNWAISKGRANSEAAPVDRALRVIAKIREIVLRDSPILYGGSIDIDSVLDFAKRPEIDGVLVGSASLRASIFVEICKIWADAKNFKNDVNLKNLSETDSESG